ncbi:spondin domain-containing protein [Simiduia curdlanivorans]|uniref:Spondin domain-containing protein n=1 Tax=Simiduia curdlanivorans TaxID=1492769 RepID=A0ABV8UYV7_9GAMM|nr:spondin domain-containing protein [Simiduia curdlanivorans]MDN3640477.1 spondin domain-containing protein [Simiduia curdlanivorans]
MQIKNTARLFAPLAFLAASLSSLPSVAADYAIEIQNLTRGTYFTPLLVAAHPESTHLFQSGMASSSALQAMAEGGDISGLAAAVTAVAGDMVANPAAGLLLPGASTTAMINNDANAANTQLSIVAMLLPTNDGFVGIDSLTLPTEPGTYTYNLNAYDAGTEANNELRGSGMPGQAGMPVPPPLEAEIGMNGTGQAGSAEGFVHIHRGVLGDMDATGGLSDISATAHRWLNPVARITVTVQ